MNPDSRAEPHTKGSQMSKHVHPRPRITARIALRVLAEVIIGLPVTTGKRAAK